MDSGVYIPYLTDFGTVTAPIAGTVKHGVDTIDGVVKIMDSNGWIYPQTIAKKNVNSNYAFATDNGRHNYLLVDVTSGNIAINLPPASEYSGKLFVAHVAGDISLNDLDIVADGSDTINGGIDELEGEASVQVEGKFNVIALVSNDVDKWFITT